MSACAVFTAELPERASILPLFSAPRALKITSHSRRAMLLTIWSRYFSDMLFLFRADFGLLMPLTPRAKYTYAAAGKRSAAGFSRARRPGTQARNAEFAHACAAIGA